MNELLFYFLSLWLLISSSAVAFSTYPVRSILSLISVFLATAILWLGLGAEFLALSLIFVYVGAVMALFLFIVFMLNIDYIKSYVSPMKRFVLMVFGVSVVGYVGLRVGQGAEVSLLPELEFGVSTQLIGEQLYNVYWFYVLIIGLLLLVAMMGAIMLVNRQSTQAKQQDINQQVARDKRQAITWVSS